MSDIQADRLQSYLDAEKKALNSQEYNDGTKKVRRADLGDIGTGINQLLATGVGSTSGGCRSKRVIMRDI